MSLSPRERAISRAVEVFATSQGKGMSPIYDALVASFWREEVLRGHVHQAMVLAQIEHRHALENHSKDSQSENFWRGHAFTFALALDDIGQAAVRAKDGAA